MTYLTICQDTRRECRVAGNSSTPSTVVGQTGRLGDIVAWVAQAYTELQLSNENWRWLRSTFTVNTVASDDTYAYGDCTDSRLSAVISRFLRWWETDGDDCSNIRIYLTSAGVAGEQFLTVLPWESFRRIYKMGSQTDGFPCHVTIDPQNQLVLGPAPDAIYTISGEYQRSPQILADNADVPEMPTHFHSLLQYLAMQKYGASNVAQEVYQRGFDGALELMNRLEASQLPQITVGGTLE